MVRLWWDKPWPMRLIAIARLPMQVPMITQALKIRRSPDRTRQDPGSRSAASSARLGSVSGMTVRPLRT